MTQQALRIVTVVGARPQFIKAAAVSRAAAHLNAESRNGLRVDEVIVHTGQHYDYEMSALFFGELSIPTPRFNLGVGSGAHGRQTGAMLDGLEQTLVRERPDCVLVYGDTNSTLAGALAASKLHIPVAHVEAGLRSFNRRMPEEINRVIVDRISDVLFCPTEAAVENLAHEGITSGVHKVGDVMYDSILGNAELAARRSGILSSLALAPKSYYLATIHRAENTDRAEAVREIFAALGMIDGPVVVPLHPRTRKALDRHAVGVAPQVRLIAPVSYLDMLVLEKNARAILTDSGGVQKEAYFLAVPCITLREETEWVELVQARANFLAGCQRGRIMEGIEWSRQWRAPSGCESLYGDGNAGRAIVERLAARPW